MSKRNKIIYWVATIWMALGMVSSGLVQIVGMDEEVALFSSLGYPLYFMTFLGVAKMLGVIVALLPKLPVLKEWVYAGFVFTMFGAFYSHMVMHHSFGETFPPVFLLTLTLVSYFFRPASRKAGAIEIN